jgi:hypothetical protein
MDMTGGGFIAVGVGAALGAWLRWWLGVALNAVTPNLPLGTLAANLISSPQAPRPEILRSLWFYIHIPTTFLGYAAFFVAFSAGIMYLIQERELKRKKPIPFEAAVELLSKDSGVGPEAAAVGPIWTLSCSRAGRFAGPRLCLSTCALGR